MMAECPHVNTGSRHGRGRGRVSWPVMLLTLAAVTSCSLSGLCLYQLLALKAEVEGLKSDIQSRREEQRETSQSVGQMSSSRDTPEPAESLVAKPPWPSVRSKRLAPEVGTSVSQPFLQMLADSNRQTFRKDYELEPHSAIPWQAGLQRGTALQMSGDSITVREEGYYFVYSQVYYNDNYFTMGHVVIRRKRNKVGNDRQDVVLFRCIQSMNLTHPFNTCYTGGVVKLDVGDEVELLIPRFPANVCLEGDSTFFGCIRLT